MRKSTRSKSQNKTTNSKEKKNSTEISEPSTKIDDNETEEVQAQSNANEETLAQPRSDNSHIPSHSNSKNLFKFNNQGHPQSLIYFDFGTGKKFASRTDPKKGFSESVFNIQSTLLNRPPNPEFKNQVHKLTNKSAEDKENESMLLENEQTGEENEERVFECPAILYRLQLQENDSNVNTPPFKTSDSPFTATNQSKPPQLQSILGTRPKSPFTPSCLSRTSSTTNGSADSTSSTESKHKYELNGRSNSTPNSKFIEIGNGSLHLNKCNGFYRLVMRRSQVGKVCLNMRVFKDMNPRLHSRNYIKFIGCSNPNANKEEKNDPSDLKFEIYMLKFKEENEQKELFAKLKDAINDDGKK